MFSSIFGKRRSSPVDDDNPPIPGAKADDFVVVDPLSPGGSVYPSIPSGASPMPPHRRPAPPIPQNRPVIDQTFHYLQGVPFSMCRELQMASNKDGLVTEIGDILAFLTNKLNVRNYEYDFSVEKSVLKEC